MSRLLVVVVWVFVSVVALGIPCKTFALTQPILRNGEPIFTVSIVNPTANNATSVAFESVPIVSSIPGVYVLESLSSPTCEIQNGVLGTVATVVLSVALVPAHSTVNCSLKMSRSLMSDYLAGLEFNPSANSPDDIFLSDSDWVFGPILDLSLQVEQIRPFPNIGESTGLVRVTVHNFGPWYLDQVNFGYCQTFELAPFTLDNALPDACADANYGPTCWAVGAPSVQFGITALSPGETKSCVLRATANEPLVEPIRFGISLVNDSAYLEGDELLQDWDHHNDQATLEIAPISGAGRSVAVPLSSSVIATLIGIFLTFGAAAADRRVRNTRMTAQKALTNRTRTRV